MNAAHTVTRRQFSAATAALAGGFGVAACSSSGDSYHAAVQRIWRIGDVPNLPPTGLQQELVRLATLAPSSHNTQCWRFAIETPRRLSILPDMARRCPAVDPDDHHLYVSLGCAAENLVQAALAHGFKAQAAFDVQRNAIGITLEPTPALSTPLFKAIAQRQCTRGEYDGKPLPSDDLATLANAAAGSSVELTLLTGKAALERVLAFVVQGNTAQMNDPAFVNELKTWIRFSSADAVRLGDGLYAASSGNPALPAWLGSVLFGLVFRPEAENDKYAMHIRSSAGIAVFSARSAEQANWVEVGRSYERFALQAAALGIRNAMINPPVEVASLREPFASAVGMAGRRPDLVVRFGRGPKLPPSLRRPVAAVLV
jgi:hypothetical protein